MRVLIRRSLGVDNQIDYLDTDITTDVLTIGRGADQDIQLKHPSTLREHAVIDLASNQWVIKSLGEDQVDVNAEPVNKSKLQVGDRLRIGELEIEILDAPTGFNLAIQIQEVDLGIDNKKNFEESLFQKNPRPKTRMLSWALCIIFFTALFAIPFATVFKPDLQAKFRQMSVFSDEHWATGPLQAAHRIPEIGNDCQVCHTKPFNRISNDQCKACHTDVGLHQDKVSELDEHKRCSTCHKEHKEPANVVQTNQELCINCHETLHSIDDSISPKMSVSNFSNDHPEFSLSMLAQDESDPASWSMERSEFTDALKEQSNLSFSHQQHLAPEGIQTPVGKQVLNCETCHKLDLKGQYMQPITMENSCSSCHSLSFDENDPDRLVPHGTPELVLLRLEEYYSRIYLENALNSESKVDKKQGIQRLRRPGKDIDKTKRDEILKNARGQAHSTATNLFEKTLCITCHEISKDTGSQRLAPWKVNPVKIASRWMHHAEFDHYQHRTQDCADCHLAGQSQTSEDILLPKIEICRDCHVGQFRTDKVSTSCVSCHNFHHPEIGLY